MKNIPISLIGSRVSVFRFNPLGGVLLFCFRLPSNVRKLTLNVYAVTWDTLTTRTLFLSVWRTVPCSTIHMYRLMRTLYVSRIRQYQSCGVFCVQSTIPNRIQAPHTECNNNKQKIYAHKYHSKIFFSKTHTHVTPLLLHTKYTIFLPFTFVYLIWLTVFDNGFIKKTDYVFRYEAIRESIKRFALIYLPC